MKRVVLIIIIAVMVILGAMIALPLFFKGSLLQQVKKTINNQVNATVDFDDFTVSLFNDFPKVQLKLENLTITGNQEFAKDTLVSISDLSTNISLADLFSSNGFEIRSLNIEKPSIKLISKKSGAVNWDIVKADETSPSPTVQEKTDNNEEGVKLNLSKIIINGLNFCYSDESSPMLIALKNTDVRSNGELEGSITKLKIDAAVEEFLLNYDSVNYISKTKLRATSLLEADYEKMSFLFKDAKLWLNDLPLALNGMFEMPGDSIFLDLGFKSEKSDFTTLLALVPADFQPYLDQIETEGFAEFSGQVKGIYYEEIYPAINVKLGISNSTFKYKELPEKIDDINVSASIQKPEGKLERLSVSIEKAHASIRNNPIDLSLQIKQPLTDPEINGSFAGTVDFSTLKQAIPIDSLDISGILKADMRMKGKLSSIEKHDFSNFKSEGSALLSNLVIRNNQINKPLQISSGKVKITTDRINIESINGKIGQSDFSLLGYVSNYLPYVFNNESLKGTFKLNSELINLTELSTIQTSGNESENKENKQTVSVDADSILAFQVPANLNLGFASSIRKAVFDQMVIEDINGLIKVENEKIDLSGLTMQLLKGKMTINGTYKGNKQLRPDFDFKLDISKFDVPSAYRSLSIIRKYVPVAAKSQGTFSTKLTLSGKMNEKLELIPNTLNGKGVFNTQNLMIIDSPTFDQIRGVIKKEKLKNVKVDDFTAQIEIEDGKLMIEPFKTTIADQKTTIYGNVSSDQKVELNMDFIINREDLGNDINKGLGILPGSQNIKMIDVTVLIRGPLKKPEISLDLSKAKKQIEEEVKKASVDEIKKSVKKVGDELKKLFK